MEWNRIIKAGLFGICFIVLIFFPAFKSYGLYFMWIVMEIVIFLLFTFTLMDNGRALHPHVIKKTVNPYGDFLEASNPPVYNTPSPAVLPQQKTNIAQPIVNTEEEPKEETVENFDNVEDDTQNFKKPYEQKKWKCPISKCKLSFATKKKLAMHVLEDHADNYKKM